MSIQVGIVGGSGYTGGELLRILLDHPHVDVEFVTSRQHLGEYVYQVHPNLRKRTNIKFSSNEALQPVDVLFLALPHGQAQQKIDTFAQVSPRIIDLSADFRLRSAGLYHQWYGTEHLAPQWLERFEYGLPELHRVPLRTANYISGVGCNATACILSLLPLVNGDLLEKSQQVVFEIKIGSSEGGAEGNPGSHHPERSGVIRTFSPFGHRHTAEIIQELGLIDPILTMTAVDLVRGVLVTAHVKVKSGTTNKDLWVAYRAAAAENPFIRVVKEQRGIYRMPEPKILSGSNYADLGFEFNEKTSHVVAMCAIDNLMKGAAGSAVQSMNLGLGFDEQAGLGFPGLQPI